MKTDAPLLLLSAMPHSFYARRNSTLSHDTAPSDLRHQPSTTEFIHAMRIAHSSALIMVFTFLCTLITSLEAGLTYGIASSLVVLLYKLSDVCTCIQNAIHVFSIAVPTRVIQSDFPRAKVRTHDSRSMR